MYPRVRVPEQDECHRYRYQLFDRQLPAGKGKGIPRYTCCHSLLDVIRKMEENVELWLVEPARSPAVEEYLYLRV